ncbi:VacJ family lipoprotein [uncultured Halopseudomonas sp.]|uniref:MlaA family lipoprotein n=1 Tax=uncultured Halopseudomonas sp. TaxID=2901193 RepID=UPI0030EDDCFF|tara:strand:- start:1741 stop:2469 length:729 start_codon:yes stop_codon:yes gene_type:complete
MKVLPFTSRIVLAGLVAVAGTGTVAAQEEYEDYAIEPIEADPWEPVNRAVFSFNDTVDRYTLKPIAKAYDWAVPEPVSKSISNVFNNLGEPRNLVNDTLQGKFHAAGIDTARFLLNSTVGVLGVFDVATKMGLQRNDEDFGQTLGAWGVPSGPYVVLPLLGPSTVRDGGSRIPESYAAYWYTEQVDHVPTRNTAIGTDLVDTRASLLSREELIRGDRYRFVRNAFLQNREFQVKDGEVEDQF